jgi:hypothetical protein
MVFIWEAAWLLVGEPTGVRFLQTVLVVMTVLPLLFAISAFFRHGWARIGLAAVGLLGVLSFPLRLALESDLPLRGFSASIVFENVLYAGANALIVVLLFLPQSSRWFRTRPK